MRETSEVSFSIAHNLVDNCCGKLSFLAAAFGLMHKDGYQIETDEWEGLRRFCNDMVNELDEVQKRVKQAR